MHRGGNNKVLSACKRKSFQLLLPYIIWAFLQTLHNSDFSTTRLINLILHPDTSFWFLWILYLISIIFIGCQWLAHLTKKDELIFVLITCIILFVTMAVYDIRVFGFQFLSYYYLFYTLGYCIHRFPLLQFINNRIAVLLFAVWLFMAWFWNMHNLPSWFPVIPHVPSSLLQYAYRGLSAAIAIFLLFYYFQNILNVENGTNRLIARCGAVSLGLYVVHPFIMGYVRQAICYILPGANINFQITLIFVLTICMSIFVVELLKKNSLTERFLLGKV